MSRQHIIVCEGYDDRSFWAGLLLHLGLQDPTAGCGPGRRPQVRDPWGRPVVSGRFAFYTAGGTFVLLVPCNGGDEVFLAAEQHLRGRSTHPIGRLVVNIDADSDAGATTGPRSDVAIRNFITAQGGELRADGTGLVDTVTVVPAVWSSDAQPDSPGVPGKQTLERVVCAAITAAYPARAPSVDRWLADPPRGEPLTHKQFSLSYLAKWYAEHGADDFFRALWRDPAIARELVRQLEVAGTWTHLQALAAD